MYTYKNVTLKVSSTSRNLRFSVGTNPTMRLWNCWTTEQQCFLRAQAQTCQEDVDAFSDTEGHGHHTKSSGRTCGTTACSSTSLSIPEIRGCRVLFFLFFPPSPAFLRNELITIEAANEIREIVQDAQVVLDTNHVPAMVFSHKTRRDEAKTHVRTEPNRILIDARKLANRARGTQPLAHVQVRRRLIEHVANLEKVSKARNNPHLFLSFLSSHKLTCLPLAHTRQQLRNAAIHRHLNAQQRDPTHVWGLTWLFYRKSS